MDPIRDLQSDINSLAPGAPRSANARRDFVRTALGSGFAAAVLPVMAQSVIKTPTYRAAPAGRTNLPVVLVVSEIFGVHEHIADVAVRFARQGYLAIAPELFVRQGDAAAYGEIAKLIAEVVS